MACLAIQVFRMHLTRPFMFFPKVPGPCFLVKHIFRKQLCHLNLLDVAIQQLIPAFGFHKFQQSLVYRFAKRTALLQGDAHEIFIEGSDDDLHPAGKLSFDIETQYFFVLDKRIDLTVGDCLQAFLCRFKRDDGDSFFDQKV